MTIARSSGRAAAPRQQAADFQAGGREPVAEAACSAAQRRVMELLAGFGGPQQGRRNAEAFKTAACALEKAGCSVGLRGDVDRLELELRMPTEMAGRLRQDIPDGMTRQTPVEERTSFEVFHGIGGASAVRIRGVDTSDYRSNPADPENAPKVLKVVLESLGMAVAASEVGKLLMAPEKVQSRAEAAPQAARQVRADEETTGVFRNGVRIGPGAGSGRDGGVATPEGIPDGTLQKLSALGIEAKII